jgi:CubicO group peptidase (beta-lactamase class C family)
MHDLMKTHGFARADLTLANWRTRPFCSYAFSHVGELVPSARIAAPCKAAEPAEMIGAELLAERIGQDSIADFLTRSQSDALLVQQNGQTRLFWHAATYDPADPHIIFSITKSVTAMLLGLAQERGLCDPARPVGDYLPALKNSAYGDCALRHVLDMRVSLDFDEDYLNAAGAYARYRRAMLWNPPEPGQRPETLAALLADLPKGAAAHGGAFAYQSPNSDVLGMVLEAVTGDSYATCLTGLWQAIGAQDEAQITLDAIGTPRGAGGLSCTAHDLARLGRAMLHPAGILPAGWVAETWRGGDPAAWAKGDMADFIPGGSYINQWYRLPGEVLAGIGIHGQYLWLDRARDLVVVKLASQHLPQDDALDAENLRFLAGLGQVVT